MKYSAAELELEKNLAIFEKIFDNIQVMDEIRGFCEKNFIKVIKYKNKLMTGKWMKLMKKTPMLRLSVVAMCLNDMLKKYEKKGIEDQVFYDTLADLKIWTEDCIDNTGNIGLEELNWIRLHVNLEIFKLGRLQFQLSNYCFSPSYKANGKSIMVGQKCLSIHIPRGEKLNIEECKKSIVDAKNFFPKYFRDYSTDFMMCHSWLLYSENKSFMKEESNILNFTKMFNILGEDESPSQTFLWVFNLKIKDRELLSNKRKSGCYYNLDLLPQKTDLHKNLINYLKQGGKLGDAKGMLKFN